MSTHHLYLKAQLEASYRDHLEDEPQLLQDALIARFDSGLILEIRIASANEYAYRWLWGEAELGIDTAPLHRGINTFPNHLHDADGQVRNDPVTQPGHAPWDNLRTLIDALLSDPLLESSPA